MSPYTIAQDNVTLGDFVSINCSSRLGHDAIIGDYATLSGGVGILGFAFVGKRCFFANDSCLLPHGKVEDDVYVGVSSVVFKRAKAGEKVFGNPAMPI